MKERPGSEIEFVPVIPVDDGTRAMLAYVESAEGYARIEKARHELRNGEGIVVTPQDFADLNQRISKRVAKEHSIDA